jgi:hypothetical protein
LQLDPGPNEGFESVVQQREIQVRGNSWSNHSGSVGQQTTLAHFNLPPSMQLMEIAGSENEKGGLIEKRKSVSYAKSVRSSSFDYAKVRGFF